MSNTPDPATPAPLASHPIHLGAGATAVPQPVFTGELDWYMGYGQRHGADGREGRLLSMHTLESPATTWEVHPEGSEVVLVVSGRLRLHQEHPDGRVETLVIDPGEYAINGPGVWHTAEPLDGPATAVFITCGAGTQLRPREGPQSTST